MIALSDIKKYLSRDDTEEQNQERKEGEATQRNLYEPGYPSEDLRSFESKVDIPSPTRGDRRVSELDINGTQLVTSSPKRRVTISDDIETFCIPPNNYDNNEETLVGDGHRVDRDSSQVTVPEGPSTQDLDHVQSTETNHKDREETVQVGPEAQAPQPRSRYLTGGLDDQKKDPTYDPKADTSSTSSVDTTMVHASPEANVSTNEDETCNTELSTPEKRYNLRPRLRNVSYAPRKLSFRKSITSGPKGASELEDLRTDEKETAVEQPLGDEDTLLVDIE